MQESGGKELVDFGGILVSAGGMRRYAGITCIFVGGQIYPGEEIQDGGGCWRVPVGHLSIKVASYKAAKRPSHL